MKEDLTREQRVALCEWARANGLDPDTVTEHFKIAPGPDGPVIRYETFELDADGEPLLMPDGVTVCRTQRECPMVVPLPRALSRTQ